MRDANPDKLRILFVSPIAPGRVTFGAQRRIQGLLSYLGRHHHVTAIAPPAPDIDPDLARRSLREHCEDVVVVPWRPFGRLGKRFTQARSIVSTHSFLRRLHTSRALQEAIDETLSRRRHDVVHVEFPFFSHYRFRQAPRHERPPRLVLDEHNIEYDLVRQMARAGNGLARHLHNGIEWRKLRCEEVAAWRSSDAVVFTSVADYERARSLVHSLRSRVVSNAVDLDYFRPLTAGAGDGRTILFFGTFDYFPNVDGMLFFLRAVWPLIVESHPGARLRIIGANPPPEILALRGPRVEILGLVSDVRTYLADAAVAIVPLRVGGGTRLKLLEAMAMARPVVSTRLGAEGVDAAPGKQLLVADDPATFAAAVGRVLDDSALAERLGGAARSLTEERYSWTAAGRVLDQLYREILEASPR